MTLEAPPKKLGVRIALGVVAVALAGGMVYSFIPALSMGQNKTSTGTPVLKVNGQNLTLQEVEKYRSTGQAAQLFGLSSTGILGDDLKTLATYLVIRQKVLEQDTASIGVSSDDVNKQVADIRSKNNLQDTAKYTDALGRAGLTDVTLRQQIRAGLAAQKRQEALVKDVKATDAEVQLFFEINKANFKTEPKVIARQIVFDTKVKADEVLGKARAGSDFSALANANGGKDGGLVNGGKGASALAFPAAVSTAVFALPSGGITDVLESDKKFYIVKVDKLEAPAPKSFADAKADVLKTVEQGKKNAILESWQRDLMNKAKIETVDKTYDYSNPTVATVDGQPISYAEVLLQTYGNQQVSQLLGQLGPNGASFVNQSFKPQAVETVINQKIARAAAAKQKLALVGNDADVLALFSLWGTRDFKITDADLQAYYKKNAAQYSAPGNADLTSATFDTEAEANSFRSSFLTSKGDFTALGSAAGGTVSEFGKVPDAAPSSQSPPPAISTALSDAVFKKPNLSAAGEGSLTGVVKLEGTPTRYGLVYVRELVKTQVKPYAAVAGEVRAGVEKEKRPAAVKTFLDAQRKGIKIENNLDKVLKNQDARVKAAEAAKPAIPPAVPGTPGTGTAPSSTPATGTSSTPATGTPATGTPATGTAPSSSAPATGTPATGTTPSSTPAPATR